MIAQVRRKTLAVDVQSPTVERSVVGGETNVQKQNPDGVRRRYARALTSPPPESGQRFTPAVFEAAPGQLMQYHVSLPTQKPNEPCPFIVSISGTGQQHVNGFSRRLPCENWAVAVPLRPDWAPPLFEGSGSPGDGQWVLQQFIRHLLERYNVETDKFLLVGVSNGGSTVLRFATLWPELCRGVVAVTGSLQGLASDKELARLSGIPVDMYVGTNDECGFYQPMVDLDDKLRAIGIQPKSCLTIFDKVGHMCSVMVDGNLLRGKLQMIMMLTSGKLNTVKLDVQSPSPDGFQRMPNEDVLAHLVKFATNLGLQFEKTPEGNLIVGPGNARRRNSEELSEYIPSKTGRAFLQQNGAGYPQSPVHVAPTNPLQASAPTITSSSSPTHSGTNTAPAAVFRRPIVHGVPSRGVTSRNTVVEAPNVVQLAPRSGRRSTVTELPTHEQAPFDLTVQTSAPVAPVAATRSVPKMKAVVHAVTTARRLDPERSGRAVRFS